MNAEYDEGKIFPRTEAFHSRALLEKNITSFHELPVLMYHRVVERAPARSKYDIYVTRDHLDKQLQFLRVRGFTTITFGDLMLRPIPPKPVVLTFDDGYEDNYLHLLPLLKKYGMKAVVYILGNRKHKNNFWDIPQGEEEAPLLKKSQILEMAQSGLVEFGAHSMNHSRLTDLKPVEIRKEVKDSRKAVEKLIKKPVISFAYPYGFYNETIKKSTAEAGYTFGLSVGGAYARFGEDLMEIRRIPMFPNTSLLDLFTKTSGYYNRYRKLMGKFRVK